jgi:hypothetical protein
MSNSKTPALLSPKTLNKCALHKKANNILLSLSAASTEMIQQQSSNSNNNNINNNSSNSTSFNLASPKCTKLASGFNLDKHHICFNYYSHLNQNNLRLNNIFQEPTTPMDKSLNTPGTVTVKTTAFFPPSPPPMIDSELNHLAGMFFLLT